ncbi:MAG: hypothetical protein IJ336_09860 [Lachnospiraceae bacterium]|nr:hypothetical protein [Lachnospiraceae bacterium]MBQ7833860.1 hypothetical protein [Lachnospiraceae bacterium]
MMRRKKNGFFTFIWSFMPGAAEMYMGFMKCGLSLMALFFGGFALKTLLPGYDVFLFVPILVWFYSFFHARNLAGCTEEVLQTLGDDFIWDSFGDGTKTRIANKTLRKWGATILIVIGATMLWQNFRNIAANMIPDRYWEMLWPFFNDMPRIAVAILIIAIGIGLIVGKKKEVKDGE